MQGKSPNPPVLNQKQSKLVEEELKEMLLKGAMQPVSPCKIQYLSNLYLLSKKGGGNRPAINLKHMNNFIPYQHVKMEGLNLLQNNLLKRDYMCKLELKNLLLRSIKKAVKGICTVSVGRDTLRVLQSLFWSRSNSSNICIFKSTNFPLEKASDLCDNISG